MEATAIPVVRDLQAEAHVRAVGFWFIAASILPLGAPMAFALIALINDGRTGRFHVTSHEVAWYSGAAAVLLIGIFLRRFAPLARLLAMPIMAGVAVLLVRAIVRGGGPEKPSIGAVGYLLGWVVVAFFAGAAVLFLTPRVATTFRSEYRDAVGRPPRPRAPSHESALFWLPLVPVFVAGALMLWSALQG